MVSAAQRTRLVAIANYVAIHKQHAEYAEARPIAWFTYTWAQAKDAIDRGVTWATDCSGGVTDLFKWAGLRDPNGFGYDGTGNTDSLYDHLPHYLDVERAHPGALLIFGVNPTVHVAMVMERSGTDPVLWSFGQQGGPYIIRLSDERQAHVGQAETFLDISEL